MQISGSSAEFRTAEVISQCHQNLTLYTILKLEKSHNISQLADRRKRYGIGDYIENLKTNSINTFYRYRYRRVKRINFEKLLFIWNFSR